MNSSNWLSLSVFHLLRYFHPLHSPPQNAHFSWKIGEPLLSFSATTNIKDASLMFWMAMNPHVNQWLGSPNILQNSFSLEFLGGTHCSKTGPVNLRIRLKHFKSFFLLLLLQYFSLQGWHTFLYIIFDMTTEMQGEQQYFPYFLRPQKPSLKVSRSF